MTDLTLEELRERASEQDVLKMLREDALLIRGSSTSSPVIRREEAPKKQGFLQVWALRVLRLSLRAS